MALLLLLGQSVLATFKLQQHSIRQTNCHNQLKQTQQQKLNEMVDGFCDTSRHSESALQVVEVNEYETRVFRVLRSCDVECKQCLDWVVAGGCLRALTHGEVKSLDDISPYQLDNKPTKSKHRRLSEPKKLIDCLTLKAFQELVSLEVVNWLYLKQTNNKSLSYILPTLQK